MEKYEVLGPVTSGTVYVDGRSYCSKARSLTRSCMKLIDDFISGWHGTRGIGRRFIWTWRASDRHGVAWRGRIFVYASCLEIVADELKGGWKTTTIFAVGHPVIQRIA